MRFSDPAPLFHTTAKFILYRAVCLPWYQTVCDKNWGDGVQSILRVYWDRKGNETCDLEYVVFCACVHVCWLMHICIPVCVCLYRIIIFNKARALEIYFLQKLSPFIRL